MLCIDIILNILLHCYIIHKIDALNINLEKGIIASIAFLKYAPVVVKRSMKP